MRPSILAVAAPPLGARRAALLFDERDDTQVIAATRGWRGAWRAVMAIAGARPRVVWVVDLAKSTTIATLAARAVGARVVVDTADLVFELERSRGTRSRLSLAAVWLGERLALACASHVVVRGVRHLDLVRRRPVTFIPDLAPPDARPVPGAAIRARLGLESSFVVGLVGSYNPAPRLGITYGWDLIEALAQTPPEVCALLVGSGDGIAQLETRARELGVLERCRFPGEVPLAQLYEWVGAMDVAISTQTNNDVGAVRTTNKLPIYLACGCPVLASHVGEAARLLGPLGWTVPYRGVVDRGYPARLAEAIRAWSRTPDDAGRRREQALRVCRENFDADLHRGRALEIVDALLDDRG